MNEKEKPVLTVPVFVWFLCGSLICLLLLMAFFSFAPSKVHRTRNSSQVVGWFKMVAEPTSQVFNDDLRIITVHVNNDKIARKGRTISAFVMNTSGGNVSSWQSIQGHWRHNYDVLLVRAMANPLNREETYFAVGFRPGVQVATNR